MQWAEEFSIGIAEIDQQHMILVDCISLIEEAVGTQARWSAVHASLGRLSDFARVHFAVEESLMRILEYPEQEKHAEQHRQFSYELMALQEKSLKADVSREMVSFLSKWLHEHIVTSDRHYAEYLAAVNEERRAARKPKAA